jgi:hypothetical protein
MKEILADMTPYRISSAVNVSPKKGGCKKTP